jgi:hypothetical protein
MGFPEENAEIFPVTDQGITDSSHTISKAITRKKWIHCFCFPFPYGLLVGIAASAPLTPQR